MSIPSGDPRVAPPAQPAPRYGFVGIIVTNREHNGARLNQILAAHSDCIIGRLGMPNIEDGQLSIVVLIVHATTDRLGSLTGKLGSLAGISVKSALHKASVSDAMEAGLRVVEDCPPHPMPTPDTRAV